MKDRFIRTSYSIEIPSSKEQKEYSLSTQDVAPCHLACPVGINVKGYVTAIAIGKFEKALEIIRENNCLPSVCGRICTHPCERECTRADYGGAINIRALKRFASDYERRQSKAPAVKAHLTQKEKIAIIGAGPAGLAAAYDLAKAGYAVTIFEKERMPGGLMTLGIPDFRLPDKGVLYDIDRIKALGVTIEIGASVSNVKQFGEIRRQYDAILIATGAHREPAKYAVAKAGVEGVLDYMAFMKEQSSGTFRTNRGVLAVVGLGQSALDTARAAVRAGYSKVTLIYPRTREEFQVFPTDIETAISEGVEILFLTKALNIEQAGGKVTGIKCVKMDVTAPDAEGRRVIIERKNSEFIIKTDAVIPVEPHYPDVSFLPEKTKCEISRWGYLKVNPETLGTGEEGVFAGGDIVTGPKSVIEAMAAGRRAAKSIQSYLEGEAFASDGERVNYPMMIEPEKPSQKAAIMSKVIPWKADTSPTSETERVYSEVKAIEEARRCLRCGPCMECARCSPDCVKEVVMLKEDDLAFRARFQKNTREEIIFGKHKALELKRAIIVPPEIATVSSSNISAHATFCVVNPDLCSGCGACEEICEYRAPRVEFRDGRFVAGINKDICRECGTCAAHCPSSAITQQYFTDGYVEEETIRRLKG